MESNHIVRTNIFKIISTQMRINKPPETKQTFERLKALGYSDVDAKNLIAQCVAVELFKTFKFKKPFDKVRYIANLNKLPKEPFDEE